MSHIKSSQLFFILFPICIFILFSSLIVFSWFREGLYYGGAEVGVGPYYHPSRYLDIQKFIWWDSTAPGGLVPQFIAGVPLYFILSLLEKVFSPLIIQAILFFCLLFSMGYGMYLFASSYFGKDKIIYPTIAGLFYMFNSYMMVAVWHRFLYAGFFLAASLPILALLWKLWIDKGKFIFLFLFLLTNLVFVYMYANLTSTLVVWILCFLLTTTKVIFPWQGKKSCLNITSKFLLGLSLFLLTNLWWLIPIFKVSTQVLPQQHSIEDNIGTLVSISKQTILPFTLQFANPFYLFYSQELGSIYKSLPFLIMPWLPAIVIFIGLLLSLRTKKLASLGLFYIVAILIAKGAASPFGYPYIWGFMHTYFIGVIRNPFEKLGILLPFFGSLLLIIGLETVMIFGTKRFGKSIAKILGGIFLISILIYAFPMFTGRVLNKPDYPLKVKVPETYEQANDWFKMQKNKEGNILHLPFPDRDVVTYNWEYGYHGVEINEILFTALPSITRNVGIKRVDDTLKSLSFIFSTPFSNNEQILKVLQSFNAKYIILHKDVRWDDIPTYGKNIKLNNPLTIESTLNSLDFLEKNAVFGDLVVYKLKDQFYQPKIITLDSLNIIDPGQTDIMQILSASIGNNQVTPINKMETDSFENFSNVLLFPEQTIYTFEPSKQIMESIISQTLVNSTNYYLPFNQLIDIKQRTFTNNGELLSESILNKIISSDNLLIDLIKINPSKDSESIRSILEKYDGLIEKIFDSNFKGSSVQKQLSQIFSRVFNIHLYILEKLHAKKISEKLNQLLIKNDILPNFNIDKDKIDKVLQRRVHRFNVPIKSTYELMMTDTGILDLYPDIFSKLDIKIDGQDYKLKVGKNNELINFGQIELDKGMHEISYTLNPSSNLASNLNEFKLEGASQLINNQVLKLTANPHTGSAATLVLDKINGGDTFEVSFEALTDNADKIYLEMIEDTEGDNVADNCNKTSCYPLMLVSTQKDWQKLSLVTTPLNIATRKAYLRLLLPPNQFTSSNLQIKNFKINRLIDNNLFLKKEIKLATSAAQFVDFRKINPVKYEGKVKLERPALMFFKETFNPNWILELTHNDKKYRIDKHYLGNLYGNTYYIDKVGEYDFKLEFEPQKYVERGLIISTISWMGILLALVYSSFKRKNEAN